MSEFKWTDELVKDFCHAAFFNARNIALDCSLSDFKKKWQFDHQPKPEWEIMTGWGAGGEHPWVENDPYPPSNCKNKGCKIRSVKRLSDGEVFTVGDEVRYVTKNDGIYRYVIERFEIKGGNSMMAYNGGNGVNISMVQHSLPTVPKELGEYIPVYLTPPQLEKLLKLLK